MEVYNKVNSKSYDRLESIDLLRGIASLSVVVYHITRTKGLLNPNGLVYTTFKDAGEFGVMVFFIISGFIIPYSMYRSNYELKDFKAFFFKRIFRIEPVYILSIFFTASIYIILSKLPDIYWGANPYKVDFSNFILHLGYLVSFVKNEQWINPVYWSLGIEFQYYLLIGLIFPFLIKKSKIKNGIILLAITSISWFLFLQFIKGTYLQYGRFILRFLPVFLVGISLFQWKHKLIHKYTFIAMNSILIGICWTEYKPRTVVAIIFTLLVIFFVKKSPKIFLFLGKISFSMYLIHIPIGGGIGKLIIPHIHDELGRTVLILLSVLPIIGASYIFYKIIEEPCIQLTKKVQYKR